MTWINEKLQFLKTRFEEFSTKYYAIRPAYDKTFFTSYYAIFKYVQIVLHILLLSLGSRKHEIGGEVLVIAAIGNTTIFILNLTTILIGPSMIKAKLLNVFTEFACLASNIIFSTVASIKFTYVVKQQEDLNEDSKNSNDRLNNTQFLNISSDNDYDDPMISNHNFTLFSNSSPFEQIILLISGHFELIETLVMLLYLSLVSQIISTMYASKIFCQLKLQLESNSSLSQASSSSSNFENFNSPSNPDLYFRIYQIPPFKLLLDNISERSAERSSRPSSVIDRDEQYELELNFGEVEFNKKSKFAKKNLRKSKGNEGGIKNDKFDSQPSTSGIQSMAQSSGSSDKSSRQTRQQSKQKDNAGKEKHVQESMNRPRTRSEVLLASSTSGKTVISLSKNTARKKSLVSESTNL